MTYLKGTEFLLQHFLVVVLIFLSGIAAFFIISFGDKLVVSTGISTANLALHLIFNFLAGN